jgi:hypothetical protein
MTEYRFIYKCRRCGQFDDSLATSGEIGRPIQLLVNAVLGISSETMAPQLLSVHTCKDGGVGVSDLQGASPVADEMKNPKPQIGERGQSIGHCCGNGCIDCELWCKERPQTKGGKVV